MLIISSATARLFGFVLKVNNQRILSYLSAAASQQNGFCFKSCNKYIVQHNNYSPAHKNKFSFRLTPGMDDESIKCVLCFSDGNSSDLEECLAAAERTETTSRNRNEVKKPKQKESKKQKRKQKLKEKYLQDAEEDIKEICRDTKKNEFDTLIRKVKKTVKEKNLVSDGDDEFTSKKKRPNYFVSIQVDNPNIHKAIKEVQDEIVSHKPVLSKALVSVPTMHITIAVMHLVSSEEIQKVCDALENCYDQLSNAVCKEPLHMHFCGLSHFNNQVLYVNISNEDALERLSKIAKVVLDCLEVVGIELEDKEFQPHMTIMKLSKAPLLKKKGVRKISPLWYEKNLEKEFGQQTVKSLQLLSMLEPKDEKGYYSCKKEVLFSSGHVLTKRAEFHKEMMNKTDEIKRSIRTATLERLHKISESSSSNENLASQELIVDNDASVEVQINPGSTERTSF